MSTPVKRHFSLSTVGMLALACLLCVLATGLAEPFRPPISVQALVGRASGGSLIAVTSLLPNTTIASAQTKVFDPSGKLLSTTNAAGNGTGSVLLIDPQVAHGQRIDVQALIRDLADTNRTAVSGATATTSWRPDLAVSLDPIPAPMAGTTVPVHVTVREINGETGAAATLVLTDGAVQVASQSLQVGANRTAGADINVLFATAGDHLLTATLQGINPADDNPANNTATLTVQVRFAVLDARQIWNWSAPVIAPHHALFPDGTIWAHTGPGASNSAYVNPNTGEVTPVGWAGGGPPSVIIWDDGVTGNLIGYFGSLVMNRQDGHLRWVLGSNLGCCNYFGFPFYAIHKQSRRLIWTSDGFSIVDLATGTVISRSSGLQVRAHAVTIGGDVAYNAGDGGPGREVEKWKNIAGAQPEIVWRNWVQDLPHVGFDFSMGALSRDGSLVTTWSGDHTSPNANWRAGDLLRFDYLEGARWSRPAMAVTSPVIGATDLIYIGAITSAGAPQDKLDVPGVVQAYDQSGELIWTAPTPGLPQDLFLGDDGNLYVMAGGLLEASILVLDQRNGALKLTIDHVPGPRSTLGIYPPPESPSCEMLLRDGVIITTSTNGMAAIPLPAGFARNYDPAAPWPIRQYDNQRTSGRPY